MERHNSGRGRRSRQLAARHLLHCCLTGTTSPQLLARTGYDTATAPLAGCRRIARGCALTPGQQSPSSARISIRRTSRATRRWGTWARRRGAGERHSSGFCCDRRGGYNTAPGRFHRGRSPDHAYRAPSMAEPVARSVTPLHRITCRAMSLHRAGALKTAGVSSTFQKFGLTRPSMSSRRRRTPRRGTLGWSAGNLPCGLYHSVAEHAALYSHSRFLRTRMLALTTGGAIS